MYCASLHATHTQTNPVRSSKFSMIAFYPPDLEIMIQIAVYLPTSGDESSFIEELSKISQYLDDLKEKFLGSSSQLRKDWKVNPNNTRRGSLLNSFLSTHCLNVVVINHPTYHHLLWNCMMDSEVGRIFHNNIKLKEHLSSFYCKYDNPAVDSQHDLLRMNQLMMICIM